MRQWCRYLVLHIPYIVLPPVEDDEFWQFLYWRHVHDKVGYDALRKHGYSMLAFHNDNGLPVLFHSHTADQIAQHVKLCTMPSARYRTIVSGALLALVCRWLNRFGTRPARTAAANLAMAWVLFMRPGEMAADVAQNTRSRRTLKVGMLQWDPPEHPDKPFRYWSLLRASEKNDPKRRGRVQ